MAQEVHLEATVPDDEPNVSPGVLSPHLSLFHDHLQEELQKLQERLARLHDGEVTRIMSLTKGLKRSRASSSECLASEAVDLQLQMARLANARTMSFLEDSSEQRRVPLSPGRPAINITNSQSLSMIAPPVKPEAQQTDGSESEASSKHTDIPEQLGELKNNPSYASMQAMKTEESCLSQMYQPRREWKRDVSVTIQTMRSCQAWENLINFNTFGLGTATDQLRKWRRPSQSTTSLLVKKNRKHWVIHPQSRERLIWNILGLILLFSDLIIVPMQAFAMIARDSVRYHDIITSSYWALDIALNFRTGIMVNGLPILNPRKIAFYYLKGWFTFDLVVLIPELVSLGVMDDKNGLESFLAVLNVLRCIRVFRILKFGKVLRDFQQRINSNYFLLSFSILRLVASLVIVNHYFACLWYYIGCSGTGWIADLRRETEAGSSFAYEYLTALHWSLAQFTATMEVNPHNINERAFAVLIVFMALIIFSSFVSSITNMMAQLQNLHQERARQHEVLRHYLNKNNISMHLTVRVKTYVDSHMKEQHQHEDQEKLLQILPTQMLMDLQSESRGPVLKQHSFFQKLEEEHPQALRRSCHEGMRQLVAQPGDVIFTTDDACSRMLFVQHGSYTYTPGLRGGTTDNTAQHQQQQQQQQRRSGRKMTDKLQTLISSRRSWYSNSSATDKPSGGGFLKHLASHCRRGQWLSEAALWTMWENTGQLYSVAVGDLITIEVQDFAKVLGLHETAYAGATVYAQWFVAELNDRGATDLGLKPPLEDNRWHQAAAVIQQAAQPGEARREQSGFSDQSHSQDQSRTDSSRRTFSLKNLVRRLTTNWSG